MVKKTLNKALEIKKIVLSGGTQKCSLDNFLLQQYCSLIDDGVEFPPVEVVTDGKTFWLWDGFHRVECFRRLGRTAIPAYVTLGGLDLAQWLALSANTTHGRRRPTGVLKSALEEIRKHPKWSQKSHAEIATHVGCSRRYVVEVLGKRKPPRPKPPNRKKKDARIKDRAGNVVPEDLADRWLQRSVVEEDISKVNDLLNQVKAAVANGSEIYTLLDAKAFENAIFRLKDVLGNAVAYAVCPWCEGKGCGSCREFGFVSRALWQANR